MTAFFLGQTMSVVKKSGIVDKAQGLKPKEKKPAKHAFFPMAAEVFALLLGVSEIVFMYFSVHMYCSVGSKHVHFHSPKIY